MGRAQGSDERPLPHFFCSDEKLCEGDLEFCDVNKKGGFWVVLVLVPDKFDCLLWSRFRRGGGTGNDGDGGLKSTSSYAELKPSFVVVCNKCVCVGIDSDTDGGLGRQRNGPETGLLGTDDFVELMRCGLEIVGLTFACTCEVDLLSFNFGFVFMLGGRGLTNGRPPLS